MPSPAEQPVDLAPHLHPQARCRGSRTARREGSRPAPGAMARASATRCCWPPESVAGQRSPSPVRPTMASACSTLVPRRSGRWATRSPRWPPPKVREQGPVLEHHADPPLLRRHERTARRRGHHRGRRERTRPASGRSSPAMIRSSVVLPHRSARAVRRLVPASTVRATSRSTSTGPNRLETPTTSTPALPSIAAVRLPSPRPFGHPNVGPARIGASAPAAPRRQLHACVVRKREHSPTFGRDRGC